MNFPKPFIAAFWPMLEGPISSLSFVVESTRFDDDAAYYAATFRNLDLEIKCAVERARPAICFRRVDGEHWFQLGLTLSTLTGNKFDPLDVSALAEGFMAHYREIVRSIDTEPFDSRYLEVYAARLGGHQPW